MDMLWWIIALLGGIGRETWLVSGQMAPYLIFGFFAAGLLSAFVSPAWLERHLGGPGFLPVVKAVLLGVPLPLCSCGVIAVTASIRQHGASRAAATGFLIATPQTGVDSIVATWGMLGPVLGIFRPVIALLNGLLGGLLVSLWGEKETVASVAAGKPACSDGCCTAETLPADEPLGMAGKLVHALHYGFVTLPKDIARPLIFGMLAAGAISALLPQDALAPYIGGGVLAILVMIAVGIPIYVCATASIPLAVGFMHLGASPGAALAFLIAGPATNAATVATMWSMMGRRTTVLYVASVAITAFFAGLGYDALTTWLGMPLMGEATHHHGAMEMPNHWFTLALAAMIAYSLMEKRLMGILKGFYAPAVPEAPPAPQVVLRVKGMTCSHCAAAVTRALEAVAGPGKVAVDLEEGRATIQGEGLDLESLRRAVAGLGYDVSVLA